MNKKKSYRKKKANTKADTVELVLPEGLGTFLVPITILLGAIIIVVGLFVVANEFTTSNATNTSNADNKVKEVKNDKEKAPTSATAKELADLLRDVVDYDTMLKCLTDGTHSDKPARDESLAKSLNAQGTPNFYVNTSFFRGAYSFDDMQRKDSQFESDLNISDIKQLFDMDDTIHFGDKTKDTLFVDISDPSCPYCSISAGQNPSLNKQVGEQFILKSDGGNYVAPVPAMREQVEKGNAGYVFIYNNGHGNGALAAQALYCAYDEDAYWEAHDIIMSEDGYNLLNGKSN